MTDKKEKTPEELKLGKRINTILISALVIGIVLSYLMDVTTEIPPHTVENAKCMELYKCSYDVRIQTKLSEELLTNIAEKLKRRSPYAEKTFITYYLPCMEIGNGAWATSHFNPDLEIDIKEYMLISNPACLEKTKQE